MARRKLVPSGPRFVPVDAVRFERIGWAPGVDEYPEGIELYERARGAIVQVYVADARAFDAACFESFVAALRKEALKVIVVPHREEKVVATGKLAALIGDGVDVMTPRAAINALLEKARAEDAKALREHVELIAEEAGL